MAAMVPPPCANCGSKPGKKTCSRCLKAKYCSKECAASHWKSRHNKECNWCLQSLEPKVRELMSKDTQGRGVVVEHGQCNQSIHLRSKPFKSKDLREKTASEKEEYLKAVNTLLVAKGLPATRSLPPVGNILDNNLRHIGTLGPFDMYSDENIACEYEENILHPDPTQAKLFNRIASRIAGFPVYGPVLFMDMSVNEADSSDVCAICLEGHRLSSNSISLCGDQRHAIHIKCAANSLKSGANSCPLCRKAAQPAAKSKVVKGERKISVEMLVLRRIVANTTSILPESLTSDSVQLSVYPIDQLQSILNKSPRGQMPPGEAVVVVPSQHPSFVHLKGIQLKSGATPVTVINDPTEGW